MVSLEQVHDTPCEVGHVFTNHESKVTSFDLFVVDHVISDSVTCPACVSKVSKRVLTTGEHGDGDTSDFLKRDQGSFLRSLEPVRVVVRVYLESILGHVLRVVQN